jgi:hypothetical protein
MRSKQLFVAIGNIDDGFISEDADDVLNYKGNKDIRSVFATKFKLMVPIAACLCLIVIGVYALFRPITPDTPGRPVLQWNEGFSVEDYFKYNVGEDTGMSSSGSDMAPSYTDSRSFSAQREQLETERIIPVMAQHLIFHCQVNYNNDGSIHSMDLSWHRRGSGLDDYSDLSITAGYQEVEKIVDAIFIELDVYGNIIEQAITVTERNGIQIIAVGNENRNKTLTFLSESGWYQIEGSWNDTYSDMVLLLDWVWNHPINFERFPMSAGDHFTSTQLDQMPDAFSGYIPDFAAFGFIEQTNYVSLLNGIPYAFEGHYIGHAPEELVKEGRYYDIDGWTIIHWGIFTDPEYYSLSESLGEFNELTKQIVLDRFDVKSNNQSSISFTWDGLFIQIYSNTALELWAVLESLMDLHN